jgi:hypothetical protein
MSSSDGSIKSDATSLISHHLREILECHDDDFINELNAVNDLYFADRLEFNPSEHEFAVENFECDNDEDDDDSQKF